MKHYYLILILAIAIGFGGCSKNNSSATFTPPTARQIIYKVKESTTNRPIAGAKVSLSACSNYDAVFRCTAYSIFTVLTTDSEGNATYSGNSQVEQIKVEENHYWTRFYTSSAIFSTDLVLIPKTIIEVAIKQEKTYSPTDRLWIGQGRTFNDYKAIGLPIDTIVYVDGYGYTENQIFWKINYYDSSGIINTGSVGGSSLPFYINGFDTVRVQIKY